MPENPLTLVHDALWNLIDSNPMFDDLIPDKSRFRFNTEDNRKPFKTQNVTADYPQLWVMPTGATFNYHWTSCDTLSVLKYSFVMPTGDWRTQIYLDQLHWAMMCSIAECVPKMQSVLWHNVPLIRKCDVAGIDVGGANPKFFNDIAGFSSIWKAEVTIVTGRAAMAALSNRVNCV
jgi:hypothetical protein